MYLFSRLAVMLCALIICAMGDSVLAKTEKVFNAIATDSKGVETDIANVIFYWEEKVSETSFVPHEVREMPLKRGATTVKIKFEQIKQVLIRPGSDGTNTVVSITLKDGKTGEFVLGIAGSFKGRSDFGDVELPAVELKQVVFHN
jgi:hypothetical protein